MAIGMWMLCNRQSVNHRGDDTTGLNEGYHSVLKGTVRSCGGEAMRIDRVAWNLLENIDNMYLHRDVLKVNGATQLQHKLCRNV